MIGIDNSEAISRQEKYVGARKPATPESVVYYASDPRSEHVQGTCKLLRHANQAWRLPKICASRKKRYRLQATINLLTNTFFIAFVGMCCFAAWESKGCSLVTIIINYLSFLAKIEICFLKHCSG
jgi:hypothetical protein